MKPISPQRQPFNGPLTTPNKLAWGRVTQTAGSWWTLAPRQDWQQVIREHTARMRANSNLIPDTQRQKGGPE